MNKYTLLLGIALVVFAALYFNTCRKKLPDHSADAKSVDSMVQKEIRDSIVVMKVIDSVNKKVASLQKSKDSLTRLNANSKASLKGKDKDISDLVDAINSAEIKKDTATALTLCDSLKSAYPIAKGLVTQYILQNDSLVRVNSQIITDKDTIIQRIRGLYSMANSSLFETSRLYGNLMVDYKKAVKQSSRRFGIGPEVTLSVVGGKIAVAPGIGVHYTLIRF